MSSPGNPVRFSSQDGVIARLSQTTVCDTC